ncbi:conjugative transposon protein TraJ [Flavobacterium cerinum]|uniref:Conjugative transposon protein TraJ n=1 Tax=Flavobacterium cerinum TaxID=2502784 RepID=A0ABY5IMY3_9FLAO|nr:conjugative transposon protein TraJ [Flavobacterium cerinum]UUC44203.1 conjugative transposon protein TraJ [Flavobacterium cerinum]
MVILFLVVPVSSYGAGVASEIGSLHSVLEQLYDDMIPLCSQLIGVGQGLAGFAALWYIAARVWRHLANAEPIDFYPLFRPFAIGLCIAIFPSVLAIINGVMKPTVTGTAAMMDGSNRAIATLLLEKERAIKTTDKWKMYVGETGSGDRDKWVKYTYPELSGQNEGLLEGLAIDLEFSMDKQMYKFRNSVKEWMSEVLRVLFEAAALCIDTLRTFQLVVLAILGPIVFGLAVFDGFQHTLTVWLARYINVFLWLPVANIFGSIIGKIQENMLKVDISQIAQEGDTFFSRTDMGYLIFMIIGIVGYFTVPTVANYIVHAGGSALTQKITSMFNNSSRSTVSTGQQAAGMVADGLGNAVNRMQNDMASYGSSSPYFNEGNGSGYMGDKLKGK